MTTAYFLHAYGGPRLYGEHPDYDADSSLYLRTHIDSLFALKHNLSKIFITINTDENEGRRFRWYVKNLPSKIQSADVEVIRRPNYGVSYAAWSELIGRLAGQYDYYMFMEDDYVYVKDNFDQLMINMFDVRHRAAFLCGRLGWGHGGGYTPHAGSSNGITSSEVLTACLKHGNFPYSETKTDFDGERYGQVRWSQHFLNEGAIYDITEHFMVPFCFEGIIHLFKGEDTEDVLQVPYQYLSAYMDRKQLGF